MDSLSFHQTNKKKYSNGEEYNFKAKMFYKNLKKILGSKSKVIKNNINSQEDSKGFIINYSILAMFVILEGASTNFFTLERKSLISIIFYLLSFFDEKNYQVYSKIVNEVDGEQVLDELENNVTLYMAA